jgi:hypothetical protein
LKPGSGRGIVTPAESEETRERQLAGSRDSPHRAGPGLRQQARPAVISRNATRRLTTSMDRLPPLRLQGQEPGGNDLCPYPQPAGEPRQRVPFAALPHDLVGDPRLSATAVRLAAILLRYARGKPACWPSMARLAADLGRCRRSAQYALRELERAGWVATEPTAENATGRVLVLTWRPRVPTGAPRCTPRPQSVASPPLRAVAPEVRQQEKETPTGGPGQEGPPPVADREEERIRSMDDARSHYAGWLDRLPGDPLRILAEARLREFEPGRPAPGPPTRRRFAVVTREPDRRDTLLSTTPPGRLRPPVAKANCSPDRLCPRPGRPPL